MNDSRLSYREGENAVKFVEIFLLKNKNRKTQKKHTKKNNQQPRTRPKSESRLDKLTNS